MDKPLFTVFTPTFNRAYILPVLYHSLQKQTCQNFEWVIVDDGSEDDTSEIVSEWMKEKNAFTVKYYKTENNGKPRAVNYGVEKSSGLFFMIVDSDDYLLPDAIEKFSSWAMEIAEMKNIVGVGAARGYTPNEYIKGDGPVVGESGFIDASNLERKKYNLDADMVEAYKTDIFKCFPMEVWENEKFAPEQITMNSMALSGYKVRWHKDIVYICEYLPDGLTKGSFELEKNNPMGYAMMYNHMLLYGLNRKATFKAACQHIALSIYGRHPEYIFRSNKPLYTLAAIPVGLFLSIRRKKQFGNRK